MNIFDLIKAQVWKKVWNAPRYLYEYRATKPECREYSCFPGTMLSSLNLNSRHESHPNLTLLWPLVCETRGLERRQCDAEINSGYCQKAQEGATPFAGSDTILPPPPGSGTPHPVVLHLLISVHKLHDPLHLQHMSSIP